MTGLATAFLLSAGAAQAAECIAPANPGGGRDVNCRQIGKLFYDIGEVDKPVQVTNMADGGGGLAPTSIENERNDGPDLIVVAADSPMNSLDDLMNAIKVGEDVSFAVGSLAGGFDHLKVALLAKEAGITDIRSIKYIGVDGGADATTQTMDGFTTG